MRRARRSNRGTRVIDASPEQDLLRTGEMRDSARGQDGVRPPGPWLPPPPAGWRSSGSPLAWPLLPRAAAGRGARGATEPGGRRETPSATSRPDRRSFSGNARLAELPTDSWSGWTSLSHGARQTANPAVRSARRAVISPSRAAQAGIGEPEPDDLHRLAAPRTRRAAAVSSCAPPGQRGRLGEARMGRFAIGDRDQPQPGARRGQDGHGPAHAEHLIVGMGGQDGQTPSSR